MQTIEEDPLYKPRNTRRGGDHLTILLLVAAGRAVYFVVMVLRRFQSMDW